jgi:ribonuclease R
MAERKRRAPLPSKAQVREFIRDSAGPVGKREIARAFQVSGDDRIALKTMLKELAEEGALERHEGRRLAKPGSLPSVAVLEVTGTDLDGEVLARPVAWDPAVNPPHIYLADRGTHLEPALAAGDRVLAKLQRQPDDAYEARTIRRLARQAKRVVGVLRIGPDGAARITPTNRRERDELIVAPRDLGDAASGDLVLAEVLPSRRLGLAHARVAERLGAMGDPRTISLISIQEQGIPIDFPPAALREAEEAGPAPLGNRTDLRHIPLVTIDGADARDFDDAVWAAPDEDPRNKGGWKLLVAIADVAWYVRPDSALDRSALERGNSVYFPDRVVPMLPEQLSNGWCSLKPGEDRPCMAVWITIDGHGVKRSHKFVRGLMRSAARLTYEQVQDAADGRPDVVTRPLQDKVIAPLYGAFRALLEAREKRGTLDLEISERKVILGEDGHVADIVPRERLDSHRLIEEFMIAANVAAAEALEAKRAPVMYRIHDVPDPAKIESLREFLDSLGIRLARGQVLKPAMFTQVLAKAAKTPFAAMVNELVLRSQAQAVYSPENVGHFGLALRRYAHFTSPIRRYSDLLVHRSLISAYKLGDDGLTPEQASAFERIGAAISATERRAMAAERGAVDRYTAAYLADRVGTIFEARINGVTRFGLFATLKDSGADGLIPIGTLPTDFYRHEEHRHALVGQRWGRVYSLGEPIMVRLVEAQPVTGSLVFHLMEGSEGREAPVEAAPRRSEAERAKARKRRDAAKTAKRKGAAPDRGRTGRRRRQ